MPLDDFSGEYLVQKEKGHPTPAEMLRRELGPNTELPDPGNESFNLSPGAIAKDFLKGTIQEGVTQTFAGFTTALKEAGEAAGSLFDFLNIPSVVQLTNEKGEFDLDLLTQEEFKQRGGEFAAEKITPREPTTVTGGLIRGVAQFLTGFIPAARAAKAIGPATKAAQVAKGAAAGAVADATVFDPHEERFSNLVEKFPELKNPVTDFLKAGPEDTDAMGRFKNAVEGLGLGALTEGFLLAARGVKARRVAKLEEKAKKQEQETIEKLATAETKESIEAKEKDFKPFDEVDTSGKRFRVGSKKAGRDRAININFNRIETTEDVEALIKDFGKTFSKDINLQRREVITNEETEKFADELGMTVEDLLKFRRGQAPNAEEALAARNILIASGENVVSLAQKARTGNDIDVIQFRRGLSLHHAIQSRVSGLTAEAGRALQSFRIRAKSAKEQERLITEALDAGGGIGNSRRLADRFATLETSKQVNQAVKGTVFAKTKNMATEAWINGLLSSPQTHVVNALSNSLTAVWAVGERKVASLIGGGLDVQAVPEGEATAQLFGMVQGAKDGMRLAWTAFKTGEPTDQLAKVELAERRAITAQNLNLSGTAGRFADFVGEAVRLPGRLLITSDEFFKSVGYRMELHGQAFRQATQEGLEGDALARRINDIIENPPDNLRLEAVDASRYQTFTRPLGERAKPITEFIERNPAVRVIMPFVRTPTNIIKYVGERTALAPLSRNVRQEIAAGGARRDLALAKIATGSMIMSAVSDFAMQGSVSGKGPVNPAMNKILRETGWQPYSIKIGDTWHSYNRLDPIGATVGIAADMVDIIGQAGDVGALDIATSATIAVAQNVTSKTYLSGLSDFFEVMAGVSPDPEKNNNRALRWIERLAGSVIPAGVAVTERTLNPELSATEGIIEKIKSRIPGFSDDLPPRRNIFGEPVVLSGGLGPDIMSPIYTTTVKEDLVIDEIVKQKVPIRMPSRIVKGVRLDTHQYDKFVLLYSGKGNRFVDRPLKEALKDTMRSELYKTATDGPDGGKSMIIKTIFHKYRQAARQALFEKVDSFASEVRKNQRQKQINLGVEF
jgi:hypothetical protein